MKTLNNEREMELRRRSAEQKLRLYEDLKDYFVTQAELKGIRHARRPQIAKEAATEIINDIKYYQEYELR